MFGAAGIAVLAVSWPGHLSYDSILQLLQGRTGLYNTWHPPVMAWLMGIGDAIVPGTGLFVAFDCLLGFGAFAAITWLPPVRSWKMATVMAVLIALAPQMVLYQGIVWKDVLFADAMVAGFVALAFGARSVAALAASFVFLTLAALARQNGVVLLPLAAAAFGWQCGGAWTRRAALGAGALAAMLIAVFGINALLDLRSNGDNGPAEQFHLLQIYDLGGAVARDPAFPLPALAEEDPAAEHAIRTVGARLYTPVRNDPMVSAPEMDAALRTLDVDAASSDWRSLVTEHPWLYLKVRAASFYWVLCTPDILQARPVFTGIEGPAEEMKQPGLQPRRDARDLALASYAVAFEATPVFSHLFFLVIAVACLVALLRRRAPADMAFAAMLAGALLFTASFFVISISCDYRYLYALDLSAMAALFYLACDLYSLPALFGMKR